VVAVDGDLVPPRDRPGPLEALRLAHNAAAREAFLSAPLEEEQALGVAKEPSAPPPPPELAGPGAMWRRVERRMRPALRAHRDSPLVAALEQEARAFLRAQADLGQVQHGGRPLLMRAEGPFGRLLAHGVCQFYGLTSGSVDLSAVDGVGERAVVAYWRNSPQRAAAGAAISIRGAAACADAGGGGLRIVGGLGGGILSLPEHDVLCANMDAHAAAVTGSVSGVTDS